jgi:23S rRNA U2552 (ribose-2'-O)-methylase RlmE/FtsJ
MATAHVLVRVWLPDRPGALGQVASRIGSVRGDIVGVDVLECDGGVAIDEFAVNLADADLVPMLVREIEEVDGASVEEVRVVNHFPDPRLDALEGATRLCQAAGVKELHEALVDQVRKEFLAEWAALVTDVGPEEEHLGGNGAERATVAATAGDAPGAEHLEALALGVAASPLVASGAAGPEDLAAAPLASHRAVLLASRSGYALRERERGQLIALGRIADRLWTLLSGS